MKKLLTILFFICASFIHKPLATLTYYISNAGSTSNGGHSPSDAWPITKLSTTTFNPGDHILFNSGETFYGSIIITASGTTSNPIVYSSYGTGAAPIITGLTTVTAWTNLGSNIWESTSSVSTLPTLNMVVINGVNTAMGRTPNYPTYYTYQSATATTLTSSNLNSGTTNWTGAELVDFLTTYTIGRHGITGHSGTVLTYNTSNPDPQTPGNPFYFFIQNDVRTLDVQNEWYYNPATGKIRIYSTSSPTNVQISTITNLVSVASHTNIIFDNLSFTGSNSDAIPLGSAGHIIVQNCTFNYLGGDVVYDGGGNSKVDNCTISNCNNFGIDFKSNAFDTVTNNTIKNIGLLVGMGAVPTPSIMGNGIQCTGNNSLITNNNVDSTGLLSIRFGGDNSLIKNNFVKHFCEANGVSDGGGLYMYHGGVGNTNTNVQLINNIAINGGSDGIGIYFDDYINGVICQGNTSANCFANYQIHNVHNFLFRDNTSFNAVRAEALLLMDDGTANNSINITLKNNILFPRDNAINGDNWCLWNSTYNTLNMPTPFVSDSNYFARPINDNLTIVTFDLPAPAATKRSLAMWQPFSGQDAHSKKSPVTITNINQLFFAYDSINSPITVTLPPGTWVDVTNASFAGTTTLQPYTSIILMNTGTGVAPVANAGSDQSITWPVNSINLTGSGTDADGVIVAYSWTKISGPASYTITNPANQNTSATGLAVGVYQFQLQVTDNSGLTAKDTMQVTVNKGSASVTVTGTTVTYNGLPQQPIVTTSPAGLSYSITLNGVTGGQSEANSYSYVANATDPNFNSTAATGTFTINPATTVINASSATFNYDALQHYVIATTSPSVTGITYLFDGTTSTPPSSIAVHTEHITVVNSDYTATPLDINVTIVSNAAPIFISDTAKVYNGSPQTVTVTSAYTYTLTGVPQTNAGTYPGITATINDGVHTGSATATMTIAKADQTLTWPQPANMPQGSKLTAAILNATSSGPGAVTFDHAIGEILPLGQTVITATAAGTSNYNSATIQRTINVYPVNQFLKFLIIGANGQIIFIKQ